MIDRNSTIPRTLILILFVVGAFASRSFAADIKPLIKIGVLYPQTGREKQAGEEVINGIQLAESELKQREDLPFRFEMIYQDSGCNSTKVLDAYRKLRADKDIHYILGPVCREELAPVGVLAPRYGSLIVTLGTPPNNAVGGGEGVFTILPSLDVLARRVALFSIIDQDAGKISVLYSSDDYGKQSELSIRKMVGSFDASIVTSIEFSIDNPDFAKHLEQLTADKSKALLVFAPHELYGKFLEAAAAAKIKKVLLAGFQIQDPKISQLPLEVIPTVYYVYPIVSKLESASKFAAAYHAKYAAKAPLTFWPGAGYDGLKLLVSALATCKTDDQKCVEQQLLNTKNYQGANGVITFDEKGENIEVNSVEIRQIKDGEFSIFDSTKSTTSDQEP